MNIQRTYLREDGFYHICTMELAIMEMVYWELMDAYILEWLVERCR